jgi:hypothetical protein
VQRISGAGEESLYYYTAFSPELAASAHRERRAILEAKAQHHGELPPHLATLLDRPSTNCVPSRRQPFPIDVVDFP